MEIEKPLVSVIIPTFNRARDLLRALDSVRAQTMNNWEALVVDNHSTDDTAKIVDQMRDGRIRLLSVHNDGVIAKSRNVGIKQSRGASIAFLDSDDWWTPDKLQTSISAFERGADLVYHDMFRVDRTDQIFFFRKVRTRQVSHPAFKSLMLKGNQIVNSSVVLRRSLIDVVGFIDEGTDHIAWEDFDFWLRIAEKTEKFERLRGTLGYYWIGGGNTSGPERTLQVLAAIQNTYSAKIARWQDTPPAWMVFAKGKAEYAIQRMALAKKEFASIAWSFENFGIKLKSLVFRAMIFFRGAKMEKPDREKLR